MTSDDTLRDQMQDAAVRFSDNRRERAELAEHMAALAQQGAASGFSELEMAKLLGVDRARTLRRWLGK